MSNEVVNINKNYVLSAENAQQQLDTLLEYYDIEVDDFDNENLQNAISIACKKLVRAIRKGIIDIKDEDGVPIVYQTLNKSLKNFEGPIVYKEIKGLSKIAMKDSKENDHYGRMYAFLGSLSGEGSILFKNLTGKDLKIAEFLGTIFLQA